MKCKCAIDNNPKTKNLNHISIPGMWITAVVKWQVRNGTMYPHNLHMIGTKKSVPFAQLSRIIDRVVSP